MALFNSIRMGASAGGDYEVKRSLRFNRGDDAYLQATLGNSNLNKWTLSIWVKKAVNGEHQAILASGDSSVYTMVNFGNSDRIKFTNWHGSNKGVYITTRKFRDPSAWYHIVAIWDSGNSTAGDRIRIYVNGVRETAFDQSDNPNQNENTLINGNTQGGATWGEGKHRIGRFSNYADNSGCYYAEANFIDGQAYDPSYFGATDVITGQWNPKKYTGSYGTNGFYLNFSDNSGTTATTLGKDSSGNGNNFTPNNFVTGDAVKDSPTNNFATAQMMGTPFSSGASFSEGNLKLVTGSSASARNLNRSAFTPMLVNSSKWYAEFMPKSSNQNIFIGVGPYQVELSPTVNNTRYAYVRVSDGKAVYRTAGSETIATYGSAIGQNNVLGVYLDMDAGTPVVYFSKNGQWADGSGNFDESNPTSGITLGDTFFTTDTGGNDGFAAFIFSSSDGGSSVEIQANFGQDSTFSGQISSGGNADANGKGDFKYAVPTGAKALCSANLPDPTILLPNKHFDTLLYTGTGSSQNITGLEYQPDWVWIKKRNGSENHELQDAVRGATKRLASNTSDAESTVAGSISAFNSNGFTVVDAGTTNENGNTYVAWNWNAGGSTVTNNDGSISSQVRANTSAGISIVSYEGTGSLATVGHGLGVKPDAMIFKNRDQGHGWLVYHSSLGATKNLGLNTTSAAATASNKFNDTEPTSTVFTVNTAADSNQSGQSIIAYCFSEVAGYSKIGSYTGNGNADGTFVFTGFRPAWLLVKRTDDSKSWVLWDNKRDTYNLTANDLYPNRSDAENALSNNEVDLLSNGFKLKNSSSTINASGGTFIFLAFAESPFKNSRAR